MFSVINSDYDFQEVLIYYKRKNICGIFFLKSDKSIVNGKSLTLRASSRLRLPIPMVSEIDIHFSNGCKWNNIFIRPETGTPPRACPRITVPVNGLMKE